MRSDETEAVPVVQRYEWDEDWAQLGLGSSLGWAHHGLAMTASGELVGFHPEDSRLLVIGADGHLVRSVACPDVREGHGLTVVDGAGPSSLWVADCGFKMRRAATGEYLPDGARGIAKVVRLGLDGEVLDRLEQPSISAYDSGWYAPTWVAVDEQRHGGSGDVWVADGYGASLVHRYDHAGRYLMSLSGEEGPGRFNCPHAIYIAQRGGRRELYIADRANERVLAYDLDGTYLREIAPGRLYRPCVLTVTDDHLVIGEMGARLVFVGDDDEIAFTVGDNTPVCEEPGWPNSLDEAGNPVRPEDRLVAGRCNSPHGLAVDRHGHIYVADWLIGGRLVRLVPR